MRLADLSPAARAPLFGCALGLLAGGLEAVKLSATLKLSLGFGQALKLGLTAVLLDGLLGLGLALPVGLFVQLALRRMLRSRQHALVMASTAALLAWWFLAPAAAELHAQGRLPAAIGFLLAPVGVAGVVWFNAGYWLRREEVGEDRRLGFLAVAALGALALAGGASTVLATRTFGGGRAIATDPAVLLITIDTLRRDHISAYAPEGGPPLVSTPAFDRLAAEGVLYTDAVSPFPETAPAHSAMFTGLHPFRTGMLSNGHRLASGYKTLAEVLRDEGYATGAFLSSFAVDSRTGLDQGFQVYDDELFPWVRGFSEILLAKFLMRVILRFGDPLKFDFLLERPAPVTMDLALSWLDRNADRPFFLWVHTFDVHSPYEPHGLPGYEDNGRPGAPSVDHRFILANERDFVYTDEVRQKLRRLYQEEVAWTDARLGEFVAQVRARVGERPLLLIVTADHGEQLGEHGIEMNHHGVYEQSVRVPLLIQPVRVSGAARVVHEQVRLMDLPATVLAQLKLERDALGQTESVDLLSYVDLPHQRGASTLLMGRRTASFAQGLTYGYRADLIRPGEARTGRIKYILDPDTAREELYDLLRDPDEARSLDAEQVQLRDQLRARVLGETGMRAVQEGGGLRFERSAREKESVLSVGEDEQQMLRALGYVE